MSARAQLSQEANGFTLVEIMVSLVLLSFASVVIGKQMFLAASAARANGTIVYRTAAITGEVSRLDAIPFDSLTAGTSASPFPRRRSRIPGAPR